MKNSAMIVFILFVFCLHVHVSPVYSKEHIPDNIYEVRSGDTLPGIANQYETTVEELVLTNGLQSHTLVVGQKLYVPFIYEVTSGDSLDKISAANHSSPWLIKTVNGLSSSELYLGQKLKIPPKRMNMQGQYILMDRGEFQDWLFNQKFTRNISLIQEHHTWLPSYKQFYGTNHFHMLKSMENFHVKEMKWKTIAQNLTTFPDGTIAVSRPFDIAPEGTIGPKANAAGITIENVGNFDLGHDVMTEAQKETIITVAALLCIKFGLTPSVDSITYHHWWDLRTKERVLDNGPDYNVKTCPGTGFFGGNSTASAKNNFYPLVVQKMKEISATMH
ncbi:LysM peptidoglycan-binding domain-containing protein [Neobacillus sp. 19]|uniref:LysM peptidoglycan-binding domain-containing protein n=1 Tax=Neobacillus sp. 19 TaxID=3394458 RepID=UPI003BF74990